MKRLIIIVIIISCTNFFTACSNSKPVTSKSITDTKSPVQSSLENENDTITPDEHKVTINVNETKKITVTISPSESSVKRLVWKSSNPEVAKISQKGELKGIKKGSCFITVTFEEQSRSSGSVIVTVNGDSEIPNDTSVTTVKTPEPDTRKVPVATKKPVTNVEANVSNQVTQNVNIPPNENNTVQSRTVIQADTQQEDQTADETDIQTVIQQVTQSIIPSNTNQSEGYSTSYANQLLTLINYERTAAGLPKLQWNARLSNAAETRAYELLSNFSDTRPNGTSFLTALDECNIRYNNGQESIASGMKDPESVMKSWMNTSFNRNIILSQGYSYIGLACYIDPNDPYQYYWVFIIV